MLEAKTLDEIAAKISDLMPESAKHLQEDAQKTFKAGVQSSLQRLDLVTREEFDVQSAVLKRTREKLEALEQRVSELEAQLRSNQSASSND